MQNNYYNRPGRQTMFNIRPGEYVPFEESAKAPSQILHVIAGSQPSLQPLPR